MVRNLEIKSHKGWIKELGMFRLEKRRLKGDTMAIFKFLKHCHTEEGADLPSVAPEGKTRTNEWI